MDAEAQATHNAGHEGKGGLWTMSNVLSVLAMGIGSVGYGYSANVIAPILAFPSFNEYFELETASNGTAIKACMTAMYYVGGLVAAFGIGFVAERYGRKWAIAWSAIITLISGALLAGSVNAPMFIVFRFFSGCGGNLLSATVPIWMSEVVPAKIRGMLVDSHGAMYVFGYMLGAWVGYGFYFVDSPDAWRGPFAIQCVAPFVLLIAMYWLPESPRWLLMKDRHEEARRVLYRLHPPAEAAVEFVQIDAQMRIDKTLPTSYRDLVMKPSNRKRLLLGCGCMAFTQFSGILVITNYATTIYATLGYGTSQQLLLNCGWQTLSLGFAIVASFFVDLIKRSYMLMLGLGWCLIALTLEAALVAEFADAADNKPALKAAVAVMFLYVGGFQGCLNGTQWAFVSEIWPSHLRPKGLAMGLVAIMVMNIIFVQAAPTAFEEIGWRYYLVFIIPSFVIIFVIYFTFPDTKGMPLEDVAAIFGDVNELYNLDPKIVEEAKRHAEQDAKRLEIDSDEHIETASDVKADENDGGHTAQQV